MLVEMPIGAATMENGMEFPQKTKNGTVLWSSDSTSGYNYISEETQNTILWEYMQPYVHYSIIYNRQAMKATQVPTYRWLDKKVVLHIYNGILFGHKKNKILPFATA